MEVLSLAGVAVAPLLLPSFLRPFFTEHAEKEGERGEGRRRRGRRRGESRGVMEEGKRGGTKGHSKAFRIGMGRRGRGGVDTVTTKTVAGSDRRVGPSLVRDPTASISHTC
ncbi:hypothetical protein BHE74_00046927, partial [Ensete ventricosum]